MAAGREEDISSFEAETEATGLLNVAFGSPVALAVRTTADDWL